MHQFRVTLFEFCCPQWSNRQRLKWWNFKCSISGFRYKVSTMSIKKRGNIKSSLAIEAPGLYVYTSPFWQNPKFNPDDTCQYWIMIIPNKGRSSLKPLPTVVYTWELVNWSLHVQDQLVNFIGDPLCNVFLLHLDSDRASQCGTCCFFER